MKGKVVNMSALMIMILWTWGLTPLWVNIVGTVLMGLRIVLGGINITVEK